MPTFDPTSLRAEFPALSRTQAGRPVAFLDGPGGTQVPGCVIDAVVTYFRESNANIHGSFAASRRTDEILADARGALADLLGRACPPRIKFGQNMTSLTFALSRSIGRDPVARRRDRREPARPRGQPGAVADGRRRRRGDRARDPGPARRLHPRPRRARRAHRRPHQAGGGRLCLERGRHGQPGGEIARRTHEVGALVFVDAVHAMAHGPIDVRALDVDFLACSAYKFFGPHVGVLWGRAELLDSLPAYKVRPAEDRWETGTQCHEGIAGTLAAVEYLASVGRPIRRRRARPRAPRDAIAWPPACAPSRPTSGRCRPGCWPAWRRSRASPSTGSPTRRALPSGRRRWPSGWPDWPPAALAAELGRRAIYCWDGDFYATALMEDLGLAADGGVVRLGLVHYNTADEVDRVLAELEAVAG